MIENSKIVQLIEENRMLRVKVMLLLQLYAAVVAGDVQRAKEIELDLEELDGQA
jgi:hypothetical protein